MRRDSASTSSGLRHGHRLIEGIVLAAIGVTLLLLPMTATADDGTPPFPTIQSGFTSSLFGVAPFGNQGFGGLCGVGFGPDGSAWSVFDHSGLLAHFGPGLATANGTSLHAYSSVSSPAVCGLTSLGDKLYANVAGGVQELDGTTGAPTRLFATNFEGTGYGIAVDPETRQLVYAGQDHRLYTAAPGSDATLFSDAPVGFVDGIAFGSDSVHAEPYLFVTDFPGGLGIMRHDGTMVRGIPLHEADGIAVHGGAEPFVLVNDNDGRIYRLDFPQGNFENDPGEPTIFADNRGPDGEQLARGDMAGVSPLDGCFYVTQQGGARYLDGTVQKDVNSLVRICGGGGFQTGSPVLAVLKAGTGAGAVTSDPAGIDCGATCSHQFTGGTVVTLTATATSGSTFAGWSGGGCTGTGACTITLSADTSITATFTAAQPTLTVQKAGAGSGTVTSSPVGIDCGPICAHAYSAGTAVTLAASAGSGSTFTGWSGGGCTGNGSCVVTLTTATTVTATFEQLPAAAPGKIVYSLESAATRSDIWSVNPDGTSAANVTRNDTLGARTPSLSPDGSRIAFASVPLGTQDVMVINADGSGLRNVTSSFHPQIGQMWDPTWSPDGTRIAFKGATRTFIQDPPDVYVVNADGTGPVTQVTHLGDVHDAAWSPVDDRIAFTRLSDRALWTVRSDGSNLTQVFQPTCCARVVEPAWSPDGTKIVLEYQGWAAGCGAVIARVNSSTGGELTRLTNTDTPASCSSFAPSWSPDGTQIVFARSVGVVPDYRNDLFIISATAGETAGLTRVTATLAPNKEQEPDWGNEAEGPSPAATQTALNSSANPSVAGQSVTYTATVTADTGIPAGSVTFSDGASAISGCQALLLSAGHASCTLTYAAMGSHSVSAVYTPSSGSFLPSSSSLLTQAVNSAATTSTLTVTPPASGFGQQVTLTAAVTADAPSTGTPTGSVGFFDGAIPLSSGTLDGSGNAVLLTSTLTPGTHSLTVVYAGDGNYLGSTSAPATATVATVPGAPTSVGATAGNGSATLSWTAPASNGGSPITGYVITPYIGAVAQASSTAANVTSTSVSGLTNGTTYTFKVAALNAIGTGPDSAASNAVTPTAGGTGSTLSVTLNGQGSVTSTPAGIDCPRTCSMQVPAPPPIGYAVTLTAVPASGWGFYNWTDLRASNFNACSGTNPVCSVVLPSVAGTVPVRASFYRLPAPAGAGADGPGKIAYRYRTDSSGHGDVWTVNPDGSGRTNVTNDPVLSANTPALSPDGRRIAFANTCAISTCYLVPSSNQDIYVVNTEGSGLTNVTARFASGAQHVSGRHPTWSPDGTRLAFSGNDGSTTAEDIYVTDGTTLTRITNVGDAAYADWSPIAGDGRILFARTQSATRGLWTVRSDGSDLTKIFASSQTIASSPIWSPDATRIVFESFHPDASTGCVGFGHVLTVGADGSGLTDLAKKVCTDSQPSWSPDGTRIVFVRSGLPEVGDARDLFVMDATSGEGANLARVTSTSDSSAGELEPDWGPEATGPAEAATQTAVTSSANPSVTGEGVTYTATVTTAGLGLSRKTLSLAAAGTPTGSVTFTYGGTPIAGCQSLALSGGAATCSVSHPTAGTRSVTAAFAPDSADFAASSSAPIAQTVNRAVTSVTLAVSPASSAFGQLVTLTAAVGVLAPGSGTPAATVSFFDGGALLGSGTLDGAGHATLFTSGLLPGTHSLTAAYAGDGNYLASTSAPATATVATVAAAATAPGAPAAVNASAGTASATVTWSAPASDGGSAITGYLVTPYVGVVAQTPITTANVASVTVPGLTNGTTYTFRVAARNAVGTGPESVSNAVTPTAPLQPPTVVPPKRVVPNVVGRLLSQAKAAIKKAHCRVGKISFKPSTQAKKNRVLSQSPRARNRVRNGTYVNLTVGRGRR